MENRRSSARVRINEPCTLNVEGRKIPAQLVDLSNEGALFRVGEAKEQPVSNDEMGLDATFLLTSRSPHRLYTGEMIRRFARNGGLFIALRFWKKYTEVPGS